MDLLQAELDRTYAKRVGIDNEEYMAGLVCVAVPIIDDDGKFCAAIALQAPVARLPLTRALEHVPALQTSVKAMAQTLVRESGRAVTELVEAQRRLREASLQETEATVEALSRQAGHARRAAEALLAMCDARGQLPSGAREEARNLVAALEASFE